MEDHSKDHRLSVAFLLNRAAPADEEKPRDITHMAMMDSHCFWFPSPSSSAPTRAEAAHRQQTKKRQKRMEEAETLDGGRDSMSSSSSSEGEELLQLDETGLAKHRESALTVILPPRKRRRHVSPSQKSILESMFNLNQFPSTQEKAYLAKILNMKLKQVHSW